MEVAHRSDHVTHAVIGGGDQIHMGITDDAMFMQMLSSTLYSDKILAVTRETLCNAWDAHIESGRTDQPIQITLTREKLSIRDFGLGIPRAMIGQVYGTYGKSTKKHDGNQTGGFGLGCKSPFAYTDHFEVIIWNAGSKTIYKMTKSSAELNGKPGIIPIATVPTQEEGLEVNIDILSHDDFLRFNELLRRLISNGEINATLNGKECPVIKFSQMDQGYAITKETMLENHSPVCIRYGNVVYPLERHNEYGHVYDNVKITLEYLAKGKEHYSRGPAYSLVLQAKPHTISITPSRESLSMETKTIKTVAALLKKFLAVHTAGFSRACLELVYEKAHEMVCAGKAVQLLRSPTSQNLLADNRLANTSQGFLTDTSQAASRFMAHTYPDGLDTKDMLNRLTVMIQAKSFNVGLLQTFRRMYRRVSSQPAWIVASEGHKWYMQHIVAPMLLAVRENPQVMPQRLFAFGHTSSNWGYGQDCHRVDTFRSLTLANYLPFIRKLVVLTHSSKDLGKRLDRYRPIAEHGTKGGVLAYVVPRIAKKVVEAREFFNAQPGYTLIDLTAEMEVRETATRVAGPKKVKPVGHPTLASSLVGSTFSQQQAKDAGDDQRVEKPLFYTQLNAKSDRWSSTSRLPNFEAASSLAVVKLWGDKGAVVFSDMAANKLADAGVPSLYAFVQTELHKLPKDKQIKAFLGLSASRLKALTDKKSTARSVIDILWCPALMAKLKIAAVLPPEKELLLEIWEEEKENMVGLAAMNATVRDIPINPKALAFIEKVKASNQVRMLDISVLAGRFNSDKDDVRNPAIDFFLQTIKK